ncbi:MAG: aminotransferase class I/II-fold pyridoxal phosphate-dependent enzyme, partial [Deltaproteobacteria bacterium]|nr:aminotransferase class I/II-fold pyridoxal phosphate-dependent enzyme [Deltaproteobacteria bacterium]
MQEITQVPPLDLKRQYSPLAKEITAAFTKIFESGGFILGPDVQALEQELAYYVSAKRAIAVTSGTDALWLALKAIDIQPGDQVLTSPFTFFATVSAICNAGATPVFADICPDSFNLSAEKTEEVLKNDRDRKIKAIMPVHLYGQAA